MKRWQWLLVALASLGTGTALHAQTPAAASSAVPVVSLSASAHRQVPQDWLTVVARTTVDGQDPAAVQTQLKAVLEQALAQAQRQASPQMLEVRTGSFGIHPRHGDNGRLSGWQGQAELVIEGRDFARVSQLAGQLPRMTVSQTGFSLSRSARQQLEGEVQSEAVQKFRQRAQQLATDFGFGGYILREVMVGTVDRPEPVPVMQARAMVASAALADGPPLALAAGKEEVRITVNGNIQLR